MVKKTKRALIWMALLGLTSIVLACAGNGTGSSASARQTMDISEIQGKDWSLSEVRSSSGTVRIDRSKPDTAGIYSLKFASDSLNGTGAPNLYSGPYTSGDNNSLSIGMVRSTLMASIFENADLREHEYFNYLHNVNRWDLKDGKLELYTTGENGSPVVLVFL